MPSSMPFQNGATINDLLGLYDILIILTTIACELTKPFCGIVARD